MLFSSPSQFAVLVLLLIVGWLFGFASHPGGKKWRRAYDEERLSHAHYRDEAEAQFKDVDGRIGALERDNAALETRNAELATQLDRARGGQPVAATAAAAVPAGAVRPIAPNGSGLNVPVPQKRGWFDWARGDDLKALRGVDAELEKKLKAENVDRFAEIANLSDQDEIALERRLELPAGFIQREQWRDQARLLADGQREEHASRFT